MRGNFFINGDNVDSNWSRSGYSWCYCHRILLRLWNNSWYWSSFVHYSHRFPYKRKENIMESMKFLPYPYHILPLMAILLHCVSSNLLWCSLFRHSDLIFISNDVEWRKARGSTLSISIPLFCHVFILKKTLSLNMKSNDNLRLPECSSLRFK